ncbi:MAG TPA: GtrA family protein [Pseudomonadales bacterium]|nr:GtrA family protein [Pseudomonadales bacterium]
MTRQLFKFGVVGASAAAVHMLIVITLVQNTPLHPLLANILAFLTAFFVSYIGHRQWTFEAQDQSHSSTGPKFFLVAVTGFISNEALFFLFLKYLPLPYYGSLFLVLILVAVFTFVLSKLWAFKPA